MTNLKIYTDGACSGNPGLGGWGVVMLYGDNRKELSGFEPNTTNNRMELTAAIQGLTAIKNSSIPVSLYTDSKYIVDSINKKWIDNWVKNGWINSQKKPVANKDLWEEILRLNKIHNPEYIWVKGHSVNEFNNRCDELAVQAIKLHQK